MKTLLVFFLAIVCISDCLAGDCGRLFDRRLARRSAKVECGSCGTISEVKETPATIKTESIYRKTGEKVTITPIAPVEAKKVK